MIKKAKKGISHWMTAIIRWNTSNPLQLLVVFFQRHNRIMVGTNRLESPLLWPIAKIVPCPTMMWVRKTMKITTRSEKENPILMIVSTVEVTSNPFRVWNVFNHQVLLIVCIIVFTILVCIVQDLVQVARRIWNICITTMMTMMESTTLKMNRVAMTNKVGEKVKKESLNWITVTDMTI